MFKENLKQARINAGLSTSEIAKLLEITQTSYNKYENGLRTPNLEQFRKICLVLKVPPSKLLDIEL